MTEKDFLALEENIIILKRDLEEKYGVFLEVHRGELTASQKKNGANIFELIKVYGAAWLGKAGEAANNNTPFLPQGSIFKTIMNDKEDIFGVDKVLAAFSIWKFASKAENKKLLTSTKFIFYRVVILLLKPIIQDIGQDSSINSVITQNLLRLIANKTAFDLLMNQGLTVMTEYLNNGNDESCFKEPFMIERSNLYVFIKNSKLFTKAHSPNLIALINFQKKDMSRTKVTDVIKKVLTEQPFVELQRSPEEVDLTTPLGYVQHIVELRHLASPKVTWKAIFEYLEVKVSRPGRKTLIAWVKQNRPDWPPPTEK